ncbi:MAG: amidohydrolase family protein [Bacteroidetes bacterium]|nr:amidohydrolase family protein [Bacteroidota bacterium]
MMPSFPSPIAHALRANDSAPDQSYSASREFITRFNTALALGALLLMLLLPSRTLQGQTVDVAITGTTVIHTHERSVLEDATVLIHNGEITWVGPAAEARIPKNCHIVNGSGKYLIPGLVDGHIHFFQSGGLYTRPDAIDLRNRVPYQQDQEWIRGNIDDVFRRYLRCGITTVIDVGGPMWNFDVRASARKSVTAPRVYLTGPLIASYQPEALTTDDPPIIRVNSPEEARALVRKEAESEPDFIKVWYVVSKKLSLGREEFYPTMEAIVDESRKAGLPVWVHATELETARAAVQAGADVLVHDITDTEVDEAFLALARERGVIVMPTLWVFQSYNLVFAGQFEPTAEELGLAHPTILGSLFDMRELKEEDTPERLRGLRERTDLHKPQDVLLRNVRKMHGAGIRIAAGTDAGNIGVLHGPSLFRELQLMHAAGMDAHDILISATLNGAALLGREKQIGSIEREKIADLVLLNSNPLDDIGNISDIALVVKGGTVIHPDTLITPSPENVAQMQLNAYNATNLEAFLSVYSPDVEVFTFPDTPIYTGIEEMRRVYQEFFAFAPDVHCRLVNRITYENMVMDREIVTGVPGKETVEAVAIYEIDEGLIRKVWFIQ